MVVRVVCFALVIVKRFYTEEPVAAIAVHNRNQRCEVLWIVNWRQQTFQLIKFVHPYNGTSLKL
jgi:hypothetical protein